MSELKAYIAPTADGTGLADYYLKSEADKVIAELEESHKMEVEQLLMEITEMKQKRDTAEKLLNKALVCISNGKNNMMSLARKCNHANYKRCLAMARIAQDDWHLHNSFYAMGHKEFEKRKCEFYDKWHKRWLAIAEKFKTNSTAQQGKEEAK